MIKNIGFNSWTNTSFGKQINAIKLNNLPPPRVRQYLHNVQGVPD